MDIPTSPPRSTSDYTVACICPMGLELAPLQAMLDETHADLSTRRDQNSYVLGRMGEHNVVVAIMPDVGNNSAALVATQLVNDFPSVRFALLVGIGGGVPGEGGEDDIRLGDIVVSKPSGTFGGVVQYDLGKVKVGGVFERTGALGKPPAILRSSIVKLEAQQKVQGSRVVQFLEEMVKRFPRMAKTCTYPAEAQDRLFKAEYFHEGGQDCVDCDKAQLVKCRGARQEDGPKIHYGTIGSANVVIKDGGMREQLKRDLKIACVEMEAAGLMDTFPCLVIRGICDYADSHKNDQWQGYAAAVAAAYTKELLAIIPPLEVAKGLTLVDVVAVSQVRQVIDDTNTKLTAISEAIQMEQSSKLIDSLSSVNFWGKQLNICKRAQAGTGRWILDHQKFKAWLAGRHNTLWCQGDPGTGKTILSAIVIDHLSKTLEDKRCGIAWVYADYREHDLQTIESLFTSLLVQLFKQQGGKSKSMSKFLSFNWKEAKPSLSDYKTWFQDEIQKFDNTFLIVDALDELCTTDLCRRFIEELKGLRPAVRLLVTSRPHPGIRGLLDDGLKIEIRPRQADVVLYIKSRLETSDRLRAYMKADPSLESLVITTLTKANDRMFLKAELILNVLEQKKTVQEVKDALLSLPPTYDDCYEFSLKEIERQGPIQCDKALKVLSWLSFAMGPLTVKALQQALSVQSGDAELDVDKQPPLDDLVSVCGGLVVVDIDSVNGTQNIRLLHETTQNYLKNLRNPNFPPGHEIILKACLAYLSLHVFRNLCGFLIRADERSRKYPFLGYAAKYWSEHAIQGNLEPEFQDSIISFLESSQRHSADELMAVRRPSAWGADNGTPWTDWNRHSINRRDSPLHAAATYGLRKTIPFLLREKGYDIGRRNNFGETALHRAAQVGQTGAMEVLITHGADLYAKVNHHYLTEATPIMLAANCRQVDAVRELLNHGVDVNAFDPKYRTFPLHLAASLNTEMTQLLLDQGALVNFPAKSPNFPETYPMTSLHFAIFYSHVYEGALDRVNILLDRGANIDGQSSRGNTALHMAILSGYGVLARFLLQKGADIHLQNGQGKSAVQLAKERGHFRWFEETVPRKIHDEVQKSPALCKAIWSKNHSHVRELLEMGCDIEQKDHHGNTPWDYCILSSDVELAQIFVNYMADKDLPKHIGNAAFQTAITHMTAFDYTDQKTWEDTVRICRLLLPALDGDFGFATARSPIANYNKTFLIWAAELGRVSEAELLLDCGSDVDAADVFGNTGLMYAVNNRNIRMVDLLVKRGANLKIRDREGYTILQKAEMGDNLPIKAYLEAAWAE